MHNEDTKASIIERFNRSLKTRMWRYFTKNQTLRYLDVLQDFVRSYNDTYHRSIGMAPSNSLSPPQLTLFAAIIIIIIIKFPISTPTRTVRQSSGLCRFFIIFLQNPYLLTWLNLAKISGLCRFFNIFLQNPYLLTWLTRRLS